MATIDTSNPAFIQPTVDPNAPGATVSAGSAVGFHTTGKDVQKDVMMASAGQTAKAKIDPKNPTLAPPDPDSITHALNQATSFIKSALDVKDGNGWFGVSFTTALFAALYENMTLQQEVHFKSAMQELLVRSEKFKLDVSSAKLQQEETQNQAYKELTQALQGFLSAGVSLYSAKQTLKNYGEASSLVKGDIEAQRNTVRKMKLNDAGVNSTTDKKVIEEKLLEQKKAGWSKETQQEIDKFKAMKKQKDENIRYEAKKLDDVTNAFAQAATSTIQGASSAGQAMLDFDTAKLQLMKGINDAMAASFQQYLQNLSKTRDDASTAVDNIRDFLMRIISADTQAYSSRG